MKALPAKTVDEYLEQLPEAQRSVLEKLRRQIKTAAPKAEECISYGMPAYKYHGQLVYFAAFKEHCSFFPGSKKVIADFAEELSPFKTSAGTIQFKTSQPLPAALVKKIVKMRVKMNEERKALKKGN